MQGLQAGSIDSPFTMAKLDYVLSRAKTHKSPGFDGVPSEWFKWLDQTNRQHVLAAANKWLAAGNMPPHHPNAVVLSIEKMGGSSLLSDFSPRLLSNFCLQAYSCINERAAGQRSG